MSRKKSRAALEHQPGWTYVANNPAARAEMVSRTMQLWESQACATQRAAYPDPVEFIVHCPERPGLVHIGSESTTESFALLQVDEGRIVSDDEDDFPGIESLYWEVIYDAAPSRKVIAR